MTGNKMITVGQMEFPLHLAEPFEFHGVHSDRTLSGFKLELHIEDSEIKQKVEEMQDQAKRDDQIAVSDPFADREYMATLHLRISSSSSDSFREHFQFDVKEIDIAPRFDTIEIDAHTFTVIQNAKEMHGPSDDGVYALVRLSEEEFWQVRKLMSQDAVVVRRVGVDEKEEATLWRCGGALYWSEHDEGDVKYYKHIVGFFPSEDDPETDRSDRFNIAAAVEMFNVGRATIDLTYRFEALLHALVENGQISGEMREDILTSDTRELVEDERRHRILAPYTKVADAAEYFR